MRPSEEDWVGSLMSYRNSFVNTSSHGRGDLTCEFSGAITPRREVSKGPGGRLDPAAPVRAAARMGYLVGRLAPSPLTLLKMHTVGYRNRLHGTRGPGADELLADLDPDIQAFVMGRAESNHPLLDALTAELDRLSSRYTGTETRSDLEAENVRLREEIHALESRLAQLDPAPDECPRIGDIAPESIRQARNALNLTQTEAARRLGVSWLTLSRWENGRTRPKSVNHIRALTAMLNDAQAGMVSEATPF